MKCKRNPAALALLNQHTSILPSAKLLVAVCVHLLLQAGQGDPIEWVSNHRYHHLHCDTPLDPHSPYEGFWWSHMGWFADMKVGRQVFKDFAVQQPTLFRIVSAMAV